MNENFKNACEKVLNEAIIKIGNMPEFEKCSIYDIKRCMTEVLKTYIEIEDKNMSLERNSYIFDLNDTIKNFTKYKSKEPENKDNSRKYICALINRSCFNIDSNYIEPIKIKYLLNKEDCLKETKDFEYLFQDKKYYDYFISESSTNATLFKQNEVQAICDLLYDKFNSRYSLLRIDANIYPEESRLNKKYVLYHFNNDTINDVKEMFFYLKDANIENGIFYNKLKEYGSYTVSNIKKEAMEMPFNTAISLLVVLTRLEPENDWRIEEY